MDVGVKGEPDTVTVDPLNGAAAELRKFFRAPITLAFAPAILTAQIEIGESLHPSYRPLRLIDKTHQMGAELVVWVGTAKTASGVNALDPKLLHLVIRGLRNLIRNFRPLNLPAAIRVLVPGILGVVGGAGGRRKSNRRAGNRISGISSEVSRQRRGLSGSRQRRTGGASGGPFEIKHQARHGCGRRGAGRRRSAQHRGRCRPELGGKDSAQLGFGFPDQRGELRPFFLVFLAQRMRIDAELKHRTAGREPRPTRVKDITATRGVDDQLLARFDDAAEKFVAMDDVQPHQPRADESKTQQERAREQDNPIVRSEALRHRLVPPRDSKCDGHKPVVEKVAVTATREAHHRIFGHPHDLRVRCRREPQAPCGVAARQRIVALFGLDDRRSGIQTALYFRDTGLKRAVGFCGNGNLVTHPHGAEAEGASAAKGEEEANEHLINKRMVIVFTHGVERAERWERRRG